MFKNNPLVFIYFCFFSTYSSLLLQLLCFAENTIKTMFWEKKRQLFKNTVSKPTFSPMSKKHLSFFSKKLSLLVLGHSRRNHYLYNLSWFSLFWSLAKTDSVHENARFLFLPDTNCVRQFLLNIHFIFFILDDHPKNINFMVFHFLFLVQQHKNANFRKPHFWYPGNFVKALFWHKLTLFVFLNMPKKHKKWGKLWKQKLGPVFNTTLGPDFNTKTQIVDQFSTLQQIYRSFFLSISIYIYMRCEVRFWTNLGHFESSALDQFLNVFWSQTAGVFNFLFSWGQKSWQNVFPGRRTRCSL